MCENVNLPSRAPVVASPEGLTGSTTQVYKMDEICEQCRIQLMLRQRRYKPLKSQGGDIPRIFLILPILGHFHWVQNNKRHLKYHFYT